MPDESNCATCPLTQTNKNVYCEGSAAHNRENGIVAGAATPAERNSNHEHYASITVKSQGKGGACTSSTKHTVLGGTAICPYYKKDEPCSISCEGLAGVSRIVNYFPNKEEKEAWQQCACTTYQYAKRCLIAAAHEEVAT